MLTITWLEFIVWSVLMSVLGMAIWDIVWTALVSDARASVHYATASTKRRLAWIAVFLLILTDIVGWIT